MSLPSVVGFYSPRPQSGKTTASNILVNEFGYVPVKFAGPLKAMLMTMFATMGLSESDSLELTESRSKDNPLSELRNHTPRFLMEHLGTSWGRETVYQDLWVDVAKSRIRKLLSLGDRVVIDDLRFENEYDMLRDVFNAHLVCVMRPNQTLGFQELNPSDGKLNHRLFQHDFRNINTMQEYQDQVRAHFRKLQEA